MKNCCKKIYIFGARAGDICLLNEKRRAGLTGKTKRYM